MTKKKLTDKQKMFCKEYMIDLNATQAAIRAGYSKHTAQEIGSENLSKPIIQEYVQENLNKRAEKTELTAEMILRNIIRIGDKAEDKERYNDALKAQELLGKHKKLFADQVELQVGLADNIAKLLSGNFKTENI